MIVHDDASVHGGHSPVSGSLTGTEVFAGAVSMTIPSMKRQAAS
jgi:hypothetical protein